MSGTHYFGFLLIMLSAALLAQHWHQRRDLLVRPRALRDQAYFRLQLQRRSVASALIGVIGAAMTLVDRVPRKPLSLTLYLVGLLLGGAVILAIALADIRAARRRTESEHLELVAAELKKAKTQTLHSPPLDGEGLGEG